MAARTSFGWIGLTLTLFALVSAPISVVAAPSPAQQDATPFVEGEVLLRVEPGISAPEVARAVGGRVMRGIGDGSIHLLRVPDGAVRAVVQALNARPGVTYAEPNWLRQLHDAPNDSDYSLKWDLHNAGTLCDGTDCATPDADMDWPEAYTYLGSGFSGSAVVAVIDSGVDAGHPDLDGKIVAGWDYLDDDNDPTDTYGHGTHVSGIAVAETNNGTGTVGIGYSPNIKVMPLRVCDPSGCAISDIVDAIYYAADNGANVINLSLGGRFASSSEEQAVDYAWGQGLVIAASSGNDHLPMVEYPAAFANCIAVGSTNWHDQLAPYSNRGDALDVVAPGGDMSAYHDPGGIYSTMPTYDVYLTTLYSYSKTYDQLQGTSMAAPQVAGLAGLLFAMNVADANGNGKTNDEIRQIIESTADDLGAAGWDSSFGWGRVNACNAVGGNCSAPVNDPPVVTNIPSETIVEGQSLAAINLDDYVSDPDNSDDEMTWTYSGNVELTVSIVNRVAMISTPHLDWNGSETITFRATDPGSLWDEDSASFTATAVNDPPVVTDIADQTIAEGQSFATINLDDYVSDVDNSDAQMAWSYSGNVELAVSIVNRVATITTPSVDWNGSETIAFRATDPGSLWDEDPATFTVTAVNDPPVVTDIADQTIAEGQSFATINLDDYVSDVDNTDAEMTWSYSGNSDLTVSVVNRVATVGMPSADWNGSETITFRATDPGSLWDDDPVTFTAIGYDWAVFLPLAIKQS